jgi:WD40 repeat protein
VSMPVIPHRAASAKWVSGRLTVSSTLTGHSGPVTCMSTLHTLVITGSSDGTARVWDLAHNRQQHLLQMPGQEGVVAVALPSVSLAVTATARGGAVLWRAGRAIRRFEPVPVSEVCSGLPNDAIV